MEDGWNFVWEGDGFAWLSTMMGGMAIIRIVETIVKHVRNHKKHIFYLPYIAHLLVLTFDSVYEIFWAGEWIEPMDWVEGYVFQPWIELSWYVVISWFLFIFTVYFSLPPDEKMGNNYFSLEKHYNDSMVYWLPILWVESWFLNLFFWADRTIMKDPDWALIYCYDVTPLENLDWENMVIFSVICVIAYKWKNMYFMLFFYFFHWVDWYMSVIKFFIDYTTTAIFFS